ncbi:MAG: hypothetical protein OEZ39_00265 [Gammaproteobacteria bacterium]|nr:hypothetical protein [Gammaproteobacteria bacterium]MDH5650281.1 hypothetical protein [Gammaproteobacteria bacterium]
MSAQAIKKPLQTSNYFDLGEAHISPATGPCIPYRAGLINELKKENRQILVWIKYLLHRIKEGDLKKSVQVLHDMHKLVLAHFLKENISLYVYIKSLHKKNPVTGLISEIRREMGCVQAMLLMFFDAYLNRQLQQSDMRPMGKELYVLGKVLHRRIKRLESQLYPLYVPPRLI